MSVEERGRGYSLNTHPGYPPPWVPTPRHTLPGHTHTLDMPTPRYTPTPTPKTYPHPPGRDLVPKIPTPRKDMRSEINHPPSNEQTHACENITFRQLLLRAINIALPLGPTYNQLDAATKSRCFCCEEISFIDSGVKEVELCGSR